jgi:hypothetical protein
MMVEEETGDTEFHKEDREWLLGNEREYINNEESADECIHGNLSEYDNENGEGNRVKNYHNNIRYNNEYYSFLMPLVLKQQRKRTRQKEEEEQEIQLLLQEDDDMNMDQYDRFMDLYKRDIHQDEHFSASRQSLLDKESQQEGIEKKEQDQEENKQTELPNVDDQQQQLGENTLKKIRDETNQIVSILLKIDPVKRPNCKLRLSFVQERLVAYFMPLIQNITLLVYQSPVMSKLAMTRCNKNQNQIPKFGLSTIDLESVENPQSDLDYHEYTLCPTKIVRALLFQLFLRPFSLTDAEGYRIDIWHRHKWLTSFNPGLLNGQQQHYHLSMDYYRYLYRNDSEKTLVDVQHFKKEVQESATLIHECLSFYKFCPLWLREMILNGRT